MLAMAMPDPYKKLLSRIQNTTKAPRKDITPNVEAMCAGGGMLEVCGSLARF